MNDKFNELRSLLNHHDINQTRRFELDALLRKAFDSDPDEYQSKWIPYLESYSHSPYFTTYMSEVFDLDEIEKELELIPFACFEFNMDGRLIDDSSYVFFSPVMSNVVSFIWDMAQINIYGIEWVTACPHLSNLTHLRFMDSLIESYDIKKLAKSEYMANLTYLNLSGNCVGYSGVQALAESKYMANLTYLDLGESVAVGDRGVIALTESDHINRLTYLNLNGNHSNNPNYNDCSVEEMNELIEGKISSKGAEALARCSHMVHLECLNLSYNNIGDSGAIALAQSPYLANLNSLSLAGNPIGEVGRNALAKSPYLKKEICKQFE